MMVRTFWMSLVPALALVGCANLRPELAPPPAGAARIDHVIIGVADLDSGIAELERLTGVRPTVGGVHPGRGTRNALMSLGTHTYLELLTIDPDQTVENPDVHQLRGLAHITPIGWAVSGADEAGLRSTLHNAAIAVSNSQPGSRRRPDGSVLRWTTFGYAAIDHALAPFFILWADAGLHPSRTSPRGCTLKAMRIGDPDADVLRRAIGPLHLPVTVATALTPQFSLAMSCPKGDFVLH